MSGDLINYPHLIDHAMRGVVRDVLKRVEKTGLPANHHFYISYSTLHSGVKMSEQLRAKYPEEITIVIQHQFWDFKVEENFFNVTLSFGGIHEKLVVPFAALTAFADPSIKFVLQFQRLETEEVSPVYFDDKIEIENIKADELESSEDKIISLDSFRKK